MRNRNSFADVSGNIFFACQHSFNIRFIDIAALYKKFTRRLDCLFFADALQADLNIFFQEYARFKSLGRFFSRNGCFCRHSAAFESFAYNVVNIVLREVFNENMFCLRRIVNRTLSEFFVRYNNLRVFRNVADSEIFNRDVCISVFVKFFAESRRAESGRSHSRVASVSDEFNVFARNLFFVGNRLTFRGSFHVFHVGLSLCEFVLFVGFCRCFNENRCYCEGNRARRRNRRDICEICAGRSHCHCRDEGTGSCRSKQAAAENSKSEYARDTARHNRENQNRFHQNVGEINFVNTAEEVNDDRAGSRTASVADTKQTVSKQDAQAGTGI